MYVLSDHSKLFRKCTPGWRCCTIACKRETRVIFYPTWAVYLIYLGPAYHHVNRSLLILTGRLRTVGVFRVVASLPPIIVISRRERRDDRKYVCSSQATLLAMINGISMPNWWPIFESLSISRLHDLSHWCYWLLIDKILIIEHYLLITDIFMQVNCYYSSHFF